jgi:AraC-like DNA-binding protein
LGGGLVLERGSLQVWSAIDRSFRVHVVEQRGMVSDATIWQRERTPQPGMAGLLLLSEGWLRLHGAGQPRLEGPVALAVAGASADAFALTPRCTRGGTIFRSVQIVYRVDTTEERQTVRRATLPPAVAKAVGGLLAKIGGDPVPALERLFAQCAHTELIPRDLTTAITAHEPRDYQRIWGVFATAYASLRGWPSLKELAVGTGRSYRQCERVLKRMMTELGLGYWGWRELGRDVRMRRIALLLSMPSVTIAEVARVTGYGSTLALDTAFRRMKLPSPSQVRASLLSTHAMDAIEAQRAA